VSDTARCNHYLRVRCAQHVPFRTLTLFRRKLLYSNSFVSIVLTTHASIVKNVSKGKYRKDFVMDKVSETIKRVAFRNSNQIGSGIHRERKSKPRAKRDIISRWLENHRSENDKRTANVFDANHKP